MTAFFLILGVVVVCALAFAIAYNALVRLRNKVSEAWSGIDVQLERRHDLIPNLVETVQGYAAHERAVYEEVARARAAARAAQGPVQVGQAETVLGQAVGKLIAVSESYPQLQASANFLALQKELTSTEDELAAARRIYNGNVQIYNTRLQSFPATLWASAFGFAPADLFEAQAASRGVPGMSLGASA
jgi:LemA protein